MDERSHPRRCQGEEGANLVEYAMLVTFIVLACVGAASYFADETTSSFNDSSNAIVTAGSGS